MTGPSASSTSAVFSFSTLGPFQARLDPAGPVALSSKKNRALLAILATSPGLQATRERLCGLLWSDTPDEKARGALRQSLRVLRGDLGPAAEVILVNRDHLLVLDEQRVDADVISFVRLAQGRNDVQGLRRAASLYKGEFLSDHGVRAEPFEEWLAWERRRLQAIAASVFGRLAKLESGHHRIIAARRLVELDPLREASHRALMEAYAGEGEAALALQQFESCRQILREEFDIEPSDDMVELRRRIAGQGGGGPDKTGIRGREPNTSSESGLSLVVLPLVNLSGDPAQRHLADGITEDIIAALSRFRGLFVIAASSAMTYRGRQVAGTQVGKELGVRYTVEGSLRRSNDHIRIAICLNEVATGREIWAERYDYNPEDVFALQDDVARTIASTLESRLAGAVALSAKRHTVNSFAAYEHVLLAREHLSSYASSDAEAALRKAVAVDPHYAQAHAWLALALWQRFQDDPQPAILAEARMHGEEAVKLDDSDSTCHAHLGLVLLFERHFALADRSTARGIDINPSDMLALAVRADYLGRTGQGEDALAALELARKRCPHPPGYYWESRAIAEIGLRRYANAIASLAKMPAMKWWDRCYMAVCHAGLGQIEEARRHVRLAMTEKSGLSVSLFMRTEPFQTSEQSEEFLQLLRASGMPE